MTLRSATVRALKNELKAERDINNRLISASNAQVGTINDLRAALLHLADRTHEHSKGCSGCLLVERELKIARKP